MYIKKYFSLKFQSVQDHLFLSLFLFSIYKMIDIMDVYKSLDISTITVMKNPEMLKFVPDHLKTKNLCKHAFKKITLSIKIYS